MTLAELIAKSDYPDQSYHNWLKAQVESTDAKHVLEVGANLGSTAWAMLETKNTPRLTVVDDFQLSTHQALCDTLARFSNKEIIVGKDLPTMPRVLKEHPDIDLIHLDADHRTYPLLGELIICHMHSDCPTIIVHDQSDPFVQNGVNLFKHWYGEHWDFQEVTNVFSGAYLIRRKSRSRSQSAARTNVIVPPGIGDIAWVWQRLPEDFGATTVQICHGGPPRSVPFVELLPGVTHAVQIRESYAWLLQQCIPEYANPSVFKGTSFPIQVNSYLEQGMELHQVFPEVPVRYSLPFRIQPDMSMRAQALTAKYAGGLIGVYTSSTANKNWGKHTPDQWTDATLKLFRRFNPTGIAVLGADFDRSYTDAICAKLKSRGIPHVSVVGEHIGYVIELIKGMRALFAFPSGIGVIGSLVNTPTVMGMPVHLPRLQYKWVNPEMRKAKRFIHAPIENLKQMTDTFLNELNMDRP